MHVDRIRATSVTGVVVLMLVLAPGGVRADGGFFVDTTATTTQSEAASRGLLSSSGQRAVLWQSSVQCWDLYVEPGTVELANAAWVMPLPVVPEISEASADFIDQLDAATTPVFRTTREYLRITEGGDGGGCGCAGGDSAGGGAAPGEQLTGSEAPAVRVWGQGHLGDLAYEVVSTEEATALQTWLTDHDYVVPETLADRVAPYVSDGYYFFVAQVEREADAATAVSVIRFHLCDDASLFYPLRLSAYSVAESLDFTLWFVDPNAYVAPTNCSWEAPGEFYEPYTTFYDESDYEQHRELDRPFADLYAERIDEILQTESGRSLAVQYTGQIDAGDLAVRLGLLADSGVSPPLGSDRGDWSSELASIVDDGLVVTRLVGAFPAAAMDEDLWFQPTVTMEQDLAIYTRWIELWDMELPVDAGGDVGGELSRRGGHLRAASAAPVATRRGPAGSPWRLALLAAIGVVSLRRRRRRRA